MKIKQFLVLLLSSVFISNVFTESEEEIQPEYTFESSYDLSDGILSVELFRKPGTFNIYTRLEEQLPVAAFTTANLSASTQFFVKVDDKINELANSSRIKKELRVYKDYAQLVYNLDGGITVFVNFSLEKSRSGESADIVKITLTAENHGSINHKIDVKGIFDTVCGEGNSAHFITSRRSKIRFETQYQASEIEKERAVISSNGSAAFQFVLDGASVTKVEKVTLANIDELYKMDWNSVYRRGRGFSNIRGYDNSGIMIDWPEFALYPNDSKSITFYIATAVDGKEPLGLSFVDGIVEEPALPPEVETPEPKVVEKPVVNQDKRTDVDFVLPQVKDYQLDPTYIQSLIDRIDALQSSKDVNKKEVMRLNAELDAILEKLRNQ